jgi:putative hemolysin
MEEGAQAGVFEEEERDLVRRALRLDDRPVRELMTPRPNVVWLDADDQPEEILRRAREAGHSFFPVARRDLDDLLGITSVKETWARQASGKNADLLGSLQRSPLVPEGAPATSALEAFKRSGLPVSLVIDERGHIEGLVTLTDVLEALIGEVPDEDEPAEAPIVRRADGSLMVDGLLGVNELREHLGFGGLPREEVDYHTVGGMVMDNLGRVPATGDRFDWEGYTFEVLDMDGRRVDKVLITPPRGIGTEHAP